MMLEKDSIKIDGVSIGKYIVQAQFEYPKIWAGDSGRNQAGTMSGTLIGVFPKLIINFRKLSQAELELLAPIFDSAYQTVEYYDAGTASVKTVPMYTGDWGVINKGLISTHGAKNEPFSVSFISTKKRV